MFQVLGNQLVTLYAPSLTTRGYTFYKSASDSYRKVYVSTMKYPEHILLHCSDRLTLEKSRN